MIAEGLQLAFVKRDQKIRTGLPPEVLIGKALMARLRDSKGFEPRFKKEHVKVGQLPRI